MKLYPIGSYFTTEEFACKCGCGFGSKESDIDEELIRNLNFMRENLGAPLIITSGARCQEYNAKVGGVKNSAHLPDPETGQCRAADIRIDDGVDRHVLVEESFKVGFERIGVADTFIHVDTAWDRLPSPVLFLYED